ncbi:uncharacterized protein LOC128126993 [Lactuca sativa]|uniref:uncharacterized protein LOC128126993 n=1 Tax=Lactuca sativa TaxID=4236 RepID=UPI0022AED9B2|nr:uncharacterized protein LOC128126993 [Lactuca sativa]
MTVGGGGGSSGKGIGGCCSGGYDGCGCGGRGVGGGGGGRDKGNGGYDSGGVDTLQIEENSKQNPAAESDVNKNVISASGAVKHEDVVDQILFNFLEDLEEIVVNIE